MPRRRALSPTIILAGVFFILFYTNVRADTRRISKDSGNKIIVSIDGRWSQARVALGLPVLPSQVAFNAYDQKALRRAERFGLRQKRQAMNNNQQVKLFFARDALFEHILSDDQLVNTVMQNRSREIEEKQKLMAQRLQT